MKSFNNFLLESKKKSKKHNTEVPDQHTHFFPTAFGEIKEFLGKSPDIRKKIKEEITHSGEESNHFLHEREFTAKNNKEHDHPEVKSPHEFSDDEKERIKQFTAHSFDNSTHGHASSRAINCHLRTMRGSTDEPYDKDKHDPKKIQDSADKLHDIVKKHSTRKLITSYTGVPKHIGEAISKSKVGSEHRTHSFISSSTSRGVASEFSEEYENKRTNNKTEDQHIHIIEHSVHPGAGASIKEHSHYDSEHEVLIHPKHKMTYRGTTEYHESSGRKKFYVHHVETEDDSDHK